MRRPGEADAANDCIPRTVLSGCPVAECLYAALRAAPGHSHCNDDREHVAGQREHGNAVQGFAVRDERTDGG